MASETVTVLLEAALEATETAFDLDDILRITSRALLIERARNDTKRWWRLV